MNNPRKKLVVVLLLMLFVAAALLWVWRPRSSDENAGYTLTPVERGSLSELVGATGLVQPQDVIVASSPLSGQVIEIFPGAEVNKSVYEGEPLLKLDDRLPRKKLLQAEAAVRLAQLDVERAQAARDVARIELRRARSLQKKELIATETVEMAEAQLRAAGASVKVASARVAEAQAVRDQAELGVNLTVVSVPSTAHGSADRRSYLILERKVVLGQLVAPPESAHLFTLAEDISSLRVHAQVSEDDVAKVYPGLTATFSIRNDKEEDSLFEGQVTEIRPKPAQVHGVVFFDARMDIANQRNPRTGEWLLRPGMTVSVNIIIRKHPDVWKLPAAALDTELEKKPLTEAASARLARWRQRPDKAHWKTVWTLDAKQNPWPIFVRTGGVNSAGERGISDGQYLEVLEWDPELEPKPNPKDPASYPRVITGTPAGPASEQPHLKIF